jgi:diguanylate cyclase (GGDEF)-like protein
VITFFEQQNKLFWVITGLALILLVGLLDYLTGYELSFSLFYLTPIVLTTWFISRIVGIAISICSALVWLVANIASGHAYSHGAIHYWNTGIRLTFFIIVTLLLSALRNTLSREQDLARIDYTTGALNARYFLDLMQWEINRVGRYKHPFTIAYIDLDNFKTINDHFGHARGDEVLRMVAENIRACLRKTDIFARLGGDEFALLLPETGQEAARAAVSKIQRGLLDKMQKNDWPLTFSIGVLICNDGSESAEDLIKKADDLMYSVKRKGKNGISYSAVGDSGADLDF